jgi:hypothetical protein
MIHSQLPSRQPAREGWTRDKLNRERAITLGQAIDKSTLKSYGSALNSYLSFVRVHEFPVEPTPDTLSFYAVYMSHHINPRSVVTYLSGICQQLEPYFPGVREAQRAPLVERTLKGCLRSKDSHQHDDMLFLSMLLTGFFALMRLVNSPFPMINTFRTGEKFQSDPQSSFRATNMNFTYHHTKQIVSSKGTASLSKKINTVL